MYKRLCKPVSVLPWRHWNLSDISGRRLLDNSTQTHKSQSRSANKRDVDLLSVWREFDLIQILIPHLADIVIRATPKHNAKDFYPMFDSPLLVQIIMFPVCKRFCNRSCSSLWFSVSHLSHRWNHKQFSALWSPGCWLATQSREQVLLPS